MTSAPPTYDELFAENARLKSRIAELEQSLAFAQTNERKLASQSGSSQPDRDASTELEISKYTPYHHLTKEHILRYSRHLLVREVSS